MTILYGSLGYDFDNSKLGNALYLTPGANSYLNVTSQLISVPSWIENDIIKSSLTTTDYYKNPVSANISLLKSAAGSLFSTANGVDSWTSASGSNIESLALSLHSETDNFKSHTDNVSGITPVDSYVQYIPSLDTAISVGQSILQLTNVTDQIANTSPILGSMTSLFINDDIVINTATLIADTQIIANSISTNEVGTTSNLSDAQVTTILYHISNTSMLLYNRRMHDWNFYANCYNSVQNYSYLQKFISTNGVGTMSSTERYLIDNYIGTDQLKANLANT